MTDNIVLFLFVATPVVIGYVLYLLFARYRVHRTRTTMTRLLMGNLLVLAFLAALLVMGGEIYYRFFYDTTDSFGLTKVTTRWFQRHYVRNAQGFRDDVDYHFPRTPGKRRMTLLGDSFTAGHGVKDVEDRFANRIRRQLGSDTEVHVMAKNGWDTGAQLQFLQRAPADYGFDDVILVYCLNDVADLLHQRQQVYSRIYQDSTPGFLARHSYLFNTWHYRLFAIRDPDVSDYYRFTIGGYEGADWDLQQARLTALHDVVRQRKARLLVVTFPFLHALGDDYRYQSIHDQLDQCWQRLEVPHLDLLGVFRNCEPREVVVNSFDAHPNEYAHALASQAILKFLETARAR